MYDLFFGDKLRFIYANIMQLSTISSIDIMNKVIDELPSKQAVLGSNPSAITSLKKPRLVRCGFLFYN